MARASALNAPGPSGRYSWVMLAMAILVVFGALGLSQFSYPAVLPSMQSSLGLSNTQAGALATFNLAGYLSATAIAGALASRLGLRRVVLAGLLLATGAMLVTGSAPGFAVAALGRYLNCIGAAAASVPAHTIPGLWFGAERRGFVTGFITLGPALGLVLSGPLVPPLVDAYGEAGWRVSWFVLAGVAAAICLVAFFLLKDHASVDRTRSAREPRAKKATSVYRRRAIWQLSALFFAFGFAYMIYMTFFTKRLIADLGFTAHAAGNLFMLVGLASLFCGVLWGWVSDRVGRKRAIAMALGLQALCYLVFALLTPTPWLVFSAVVFGLSAWAIPPIMAASCADLVGPLAAATAYGALTMFHGFGQAAGPYVAGRLADALPSFTVSYLLAAAVAFLAGIAALFVRLDRPVC